MLLFSVGGVVHQIVNHALMATILKDNKHQSFVEEAMKDRRWKKYMELEL